LCAPVILRTHWAKPQASKTACFPDNDCIGILLAPFDPTSVVPDRGTHMTNAFRKDPQTLRRMWREGQSLSLRRRRAIVVLSTIGMASMAIVSLYQMGLVRHLPDPPLRRFDSDRVNTSDTAYAYGVPDGTLTLAAHATNIVLAAAGGANRVSDRPWLPLAIAAKAAAEAAIAAKYLFYQMPFVERRWCGYCLTDGVAHIGTFVLAWPEAWRSLSILRRRRVSV
jgi:uncharacterized membrane protein